MANEIFYDKLFGVPICLLDGDNYAEVPKKFSGYIITKNTLEFLKKVLEVNTMFQGEIVQHDKTKEQFSKTDGILMLYLEEPEENVVADMKVKCIGKFKKEPTIVWYKKFDTEEENVDYLENILLMCRPKNTFCFFSQDSIDNKVFEMLDSMGGDLHFSK